jgi:hypothetical protein
MVTGFHCPATEDAPTLISFVSKVRQLLHVGLRAMDR